MPGCPHHPTMKEIVDDHEERLRLKNSRLSAVEGEVRMMGEKLDSLLQQTKDLKASVDALTSTRTYVLGGMAVLGVIYGLLVAHGAALIRLISGG